MREHAHLFEEQLVAEELTDTEVREILTRLSARELGGSEMATVGAVAEATSASPQVIGRILADIRQVDLIDRFGKELHRHEATIAELEARTDRIQTDLSRQRGHERLSADAKEALDELTKQHVASRQAAPWLFLVVAIVLCWVFFATWRPKGATPSWAPRMSSRMLDSGEELFTNEAGDVWVVGKDGSRRQPSASEEQEAMYLRVGLSRKR